jgi:hypothetical protein
MLFQDGMSSGMKGTNAIIGMHEVKLSRYPSRGNSTLSATKESAKEMK